MKKVMNFLWLAMIFLSACTSGKGDEEEPIGPIEPEQPEIACLYVEGSSLTVAIPEEEISSLPAELESQLKAELRQIDSLLPERIIRMWQSDTVLIEKIEKHCELVRKNQPLLLLNLFARNHYEHHLTTEEKTMIQSVYDQSIKNKYRQVYYSNGEKLEQNKRADAARDAETYFAELTEAYWGENDYYPFDYEELERYDPSGFQVMEQLWGERILIPNEYGITLPPESLKQWLEGKESDLDLFYRKYLDAGGLAILSSRFVSDEALVQAQKIVNAMLARIPEALEEMLKSHFRVGIIGAYENVTDLPENRMMSIWWPETDWDARGRGYGATEWLPLMSCGEENLIKIEGYNERYPYESIMVHEFAHNVDYGLRRGREGFEDRLLAAFRHAQDNGLWAGTYSTENDAEYFAEGVQAWFNTCNMYVNIDGVSTKLKTREQLKEYDPMLYQLLSEIMPEEELEGYHFTFE